MKRIALVVLGLAVVGVVGVVCFFTFGGLSAVSSVPGCQTMDVVVGTTELFEEKLAEAAFGEIGDPKKIQLLYPTETGFRWRQSQKRFCRALLYVNHQQEGALYYAVSWQHKGMGVSFLEIIGGENEGMR
jgi:hypothetical protein